MTLLSIIVPVYNAVATIPRMLDSLRVLSPESRDAVELVVIDDGSEDKSMEMVSRMSSALRPLSVTVHTQVNQGPSAARNVGIAEASGSWILFLDADDALACDPLPFIRKEGHATALVFPVRRCRAGGFCKTFVPTVVDRRSHLDAFTSGNPIPISSIIVRKDHLAELFDSGLRGLEDWHFWLVNPSVFDHPRLVPGETLSVIYSHGGNRSADYAKMGPWRQLIAERFLLERAADLTRKQRNNLAIQADIGRIQAGGHADVRTFFRLPSSPVLFGKFLVYAVLRKKFAWFDFYGARR